jgi:hypothetical protein
MVSVGMTHRPEGGHLCERALSKITKRAPISLVGSRPLPLGDGGFWRDVRRTLDDALDRPEKVTGTLGIIGAPGRS